MAMLRGHKALQALGDAVADRRRKAGLSQEQLAAESGLHRTYIGGIERGERNPTVSTLVKLSAALGESPSSLMRRAGL